MRVVVFCHSLASDWNHGNAHFLRGVLTELALRGHDVRSYEPHDAWSVRNLLRDHGSAALRALGEAYPLLVPRRYDASDSDVEVLVDGADVVLVHEWNEPALVARIGAARAAGGRFLLLFHDTHHRAVTAPADMARYDLRHYDGVLAFGGVLRDIYLERGWTQRAWTWHEAADPRVFRPLPQPPEGDVVWIGNWGDEERSAELREFLIHPVRELGLRAALHGVRYPDDARAELAAAGIEYRGWLPNFAVPDVFGRFRVTLHVPRGPYARALRGIPTIRPFEALACGIPLISAAWDDAESLFRPNTDFLVAEDGAAMRRHLRDVLNDPTLAASLALSGRHTILERHTCAHRVDELLDILRELRPGLAAAPAHSMEVKP
jgi:spore maturation protein CgeB